MDTDYLNGLCRNEIIDSNLLITPITSIKHSGLTQNIFATILHQINKSKHRIYTGNLEYHYDMNNEEDFVIPDIILLCDSEKSIFGKYYGTPMFIVETVNGYSRQLDEDIKLKIYEKAGIPEYWIADYNKKVIDIYYLVDGGYIKIKSYIADGSSEIELRNLPIKVATADIFYDI